MRRYYACIVGKYGGPVQKALQKVRGLNPTTICSTHGPVWQRQIPQVLDIYDRLSRYEGNRAWSSPTPRCTATRSRWPSASPANWPRGTSARSGSTTFLCRPVGGPARRFPVRHADRRRPDLQRQALSRRRPAALTTLAARCIPQRNFGWFGSFCWAGASVACWGVRPEDEVGDARAHPWR